MDAVKFLQERNRMYKSGAVTPGYDYDPVNAVKIVEEWSAVHPRKTRQSVFWRSGRRRILANKAFCWYVPVRFLHRTGTQMAAAQPLIVDATTVVKNIGCRRWSDGQQANRHAVSQ